MTFALRPPLALSGTWTRLVPLERGHAAGLAAAADDPVIWRYLPYGPCTTVAEMAQLIDTLLARQAEGADLAFTVLDPADGRPIGMTRFLEIDRSHRRAEIGGTWYARAYRRTPVNTESKLLLLSEAFERQQALRIQFKTDLRNEPSQRAIERLGAKREGVLRSHMVMPDGYLRSSVVYSIVAPEWPAVRERLAEMLRRPWRSTGSTAAGTPGAASPETR